MSIGKEKFKKITDGNRMALWAEIGPVLRRKPETLEKLFRSEQRKPSDKAEMRVVQISTRLLFRFAKNKGHWPLVLPQHSLPPSEEQVAYAHIYDKLIEKDPEFVTVDGLEAKRAMRNFQSGGSQIGTN